MSEVGLRLCVSAFHVVFAICSHGVRVCPVMTSCVRGLSPWYAWGVDTRLGLGLGELGDEELLTHLEEMAFSEKLLGAEIVKHLCEVLLRELHLGLGYDSLYSYGMQHLGWSSNVAHKRGKAARAAVVCPEIVEYLETGELSLSSVLVLAPYVEDEIGRALVEEARGKSRRAVERLVAERIPEAYPRGESERLVPWAEGETRLEVTISEGCEALLREARDLDGCHDGGMAEILERAMRLYVEQRKQARFAQRGRVNGVQRQEGTECSPDTVTAQTKRVVYERDGGECCFVGKDGHRCASTYLLEYDHVVPRAHGGVSTANNIRLLCRVHNQHAAVVILGRGRVEYAKNKSSYPKQNAARENDFQLG